MNPIGAVTSAYHAFPTKGTDAIAPKLPVAPDSTTALPGSNSGFGNMLDGLVGMVDGKQAQAQAMTTSTLLGQTGNLHQSVIAMQEASTALSLMIQVRNKLVDSYQELMRMQV